MSGEITGRRIFSWAATALKSVVRQSLLGDAPRNGACGHRAVIDCDDMPDGYGNAAPVLWAGTLSLVRIHFARRPTVQSGGIPQPPARRVGRERRRSKRRCSLILPAFTSPPRQMLNEADLGAAGRPPIAEAGHQNGNRRITLVGDAAHPVAQYMACGAPVCGAGDAVAGQSAGTLDGDAQQAFALYGRCVFPARRVSSSTPRDGTSPITPPGWSVRCVICCGKGNRRRRFIAVSNGCTAGKKITVLARSALSALRDVA